MEQTSTIHFTRPTTSYWQEILPSSSISTGSKTPPYQYGYPAVLPDSRVLVLPIRQISNNSSEAVASLILNQAAIDVGVELGEMLAEIVKKYEPEVVIGLPTLGLSLASTVAQILGHSTLPTYFSQSVHSHTNAILERYVPLGYSRKFWYQECLSTETSSITSPSGLKKLYLDPNQLALIRGKKAVLIDDAVSSGKTLMSSWEFLESEDVGCQVIVSGVLMKQGDQWRELLGDEKSVKVKWVFESPLLKAVNGGWDIRE